jgi:hypothetical protein
VTERVWVGVDGLDGRWGGGEGVRLLTVGVRAGRSLAGPSIAGSVVLCDRVSTVTSSVSVAWDVTGTS